MSHRHDRSQQKEQYLATHASNILNRPSATSKEYVYYNDNNNINNNHAVSIHNTMDLQSWEQRQGISNHFDPQRRGYTFTREPALTQLQQQEPLRDRQRSRSPRNDNYSHFDDPYTESCSRKDSNYNRKQYDNRTEQPHDPRWNEGYRYQCTSYKRLPLPTRFEIDDTQRAESYARTRPREYTSIPNDEQWSTVPATNRRDRRRLDRERSNNNNNSNGNGNSYNSTADEHAPPQISYIPPSSSNNNSTNKPFMVILVGIPGSGKSTFASCLVDGKPWMYVRVNQDTLGNRYACEELAKKTLADGKCPIIDRCNFNQQQRKNFLDIATEAGVPVDGVVFQYPMALCVRRCQERHDHETIDPRDAHGIVQRMSQQFIPPLMSRVQEERFRSLKTVANLPSFQNVLMEFLNVPLGG